MTVFDNYLVDNKNEPARFTFLEETWREYFDCQSMFRAFYKDLLSEPSAVKKGQVHRCYISQ